MGKSKRELMREELARRAQESHERKDDWGLFGGFFKKGLEGVKFWACKAGTHLFDIVPYIAGPNDPYVKEGKWAYVLDVWVHQRVGVNEDSYICPARNYDKPCPICEHQKQIRKEDDYDEELVKSLSPKRRVVYNIICYDNKEEEDKGIQVWEVSHWLMEKNLAPLSQDIRTKEVIPFASPEKDGKSIQFERKGSGQNNTSYLGHKFVDRNYELSDADLDVAHCLDELIYLPSYDEISKAYWMDSGSGATEEPAKEEKAETPSHSRSRREIPLDQEEKKEAAPAEGRGRRGQQKELPKEEKVSGDGGCPHGGQFGVDLDKMEECNKCDVYDDCVGKMEDLEKEKAKGNSGGGRRGRA